MNHEEHHLRRAERPAMGKLFDSAQETLLKIARESIRSRLIEAVKKADQTCESEIEKLFLLAWAATIHQSVIGIQTSGWVADWFVVYDTDWHTQQGVFARIVNGENIEVAPDPTQDVGIGRIDYIFPQFNIDQYRADFVLVRCEVDYDFPGSDDDPLEVIRKAVLRPLVVVECDGHDFHEKTKEQAQRDKARDRYFASAGFHVLRFTGSELHRDAMKCAREVEIFFDQSARPGGHKGRRL